jgi:cysteine desulfuration protein SufE
LNQFPSTSPQDLIDNFELFDEWDDRYRYMIELGNGLPPLDEVDRREENRVQGCVSNVWLVVEENEDGTQDFQFRADSDSQLVKGLIAIVLILYSGQSPQQVVEYDIQTIFDRLELSQHLSRSRSNGLSSMVRRIILLATQQQALAPPPPVE